MQNKFPDVKLGCDVFHSISKLHVYFLLNWYKKCHATSISVDEHIG